MKTILIMMFLALSLNTAAWAGGPLHKVYNDVNLSPEFDKATANNPHIQEILQSSKEAGKKYGVVNDQLPNATSGTLAPSGYYRGYRSYGRGHGHGCYGRGYYGRGHGHGHGHR